MKRIELFDFSPKYKINGVEYIGKHTVEKHDDDEPLEGYNIYEKFDTFELAKEIACKAFDLIESDIEAEGEFWECYDGCCSGCLVKISYNGIESNRIFEDGSSIDLYLVSILDAANIEQFKYEIINHGQIFEE